MSHKHSWALAAGLVALTATAHAETFTLKVTPATVAWGNYNAAAKHVLRIHSGDTVIFDTVLTNSPTGLAKNGVPDDQIQAERLKAHAWKVCNG